MRHFFRQDFDHELQISLCARHLDLMRRTMRKRWTEVGANVWSREEVDLAAHFIRHASESRNHLSTVDFVSADAAASIKAAYDGRSNRARGFGHLNHAHLTHEHMVPGKAALEILSCRGTSLQSVTALLRGVSLRAIITKRERDRLDNWKVISGKKLKSHLPQITDIKGWKRSASEPADIPVEYLGLMRYDAAGLIGRINAVSDRAERWYAGYFNYKAGR